MATQSDRRDFGPSTSVIQSSDGGGQCKALSLRHRLSSEPSEQEQEDEVFPSVMNEMPTDVSTERLDEPRPTEDGCETLGDELQRNEVPAESVQPQKRVRKPPDRYEPAF